MYLDHFQMKEPPFSITPDTSFFFSSEQSQQALNTLLVATRGGEGFIKITGEVGSGKTLLCRLLLLHVGPDFHTAYLPNPTLTPTGLLLELATELKVDLTGLRMVSAEWQQTLLLKALNRHLLRVAARGHRVLVCLDEAQAMSLETLETLRLLTNLETEKRKLVQVVIFGQPELDDKLNQPSIRQLRQRITFEYRLGPLSRAEISRYVRHRLRVAGARPMVRFTPAAVWLLHRCTRGYPRLVNIAAHKALMSAFGRGRQMVGLAEMLDSVTDSSLLSWRLPRLTRAGLAGLAVMAGALAVEVARRA